MAKLYWLKAGLLASIALNIFQFQGGNLKAMAKDILYISSLTLNIKQECPKSSFVIAFFGQSNSANHVSRSKHIHLNNVYMYDPKSQRCYKYKEPVLGASGNQGNVITNLALKLRRRLKKPITIIAFGESGSSVLDWQYGKYSDKLDRAMAAWGKLNGINIFLWHQGETDAMREMGEATYFETLSKIILRTQKIFPSSKFGVSIATACGSSKSLEIQKAQRKSTLLPNVFKSAESDYLSNEFRSDNCHFNEKGAKKLADMYYESITQIISL